MELPLISIILVTSDASINREASFRSCVSQSYTNRELIVVDIGPDGVSRPLVDLLGPEGVTYVALSGARREVALNRGIAEAEGTYVLCMDAGSEIHEQWLEKAVQWFARSKADAIRCATMYIGGNKSGEIDMPSESSSWYQKLLFAPGFELHAVMVKCEVCSTFGEDGNPCADWEFWLATLRNRTLFVWPEYVGSFVHGDKPDPIGNDDLSWRMGRLRVLARHRHEVRGIVRKLKHGMAMRALYREYLSAGCAQPLEDGIASGWWARGLRRA